MANTQRNHCSFEKFTSLHDDTFTIRDGHRVGHDGFIVPNSFAEFFERFPSYVADWVRRRVRGCATEREAEDWTQELLLHLATLPVESIHRSDGKEDVIQTFSPERMHGANEARFRSFLNQCLANKFNTLYARWRTRPLSNPANLSLGADANYEARDEFCHAHSSYLRSAERRVRERQDQRLLLAELERIGLAKSNGLLGATGSLTGARRCASVRRGVEGAKAIA